jgi:AAHS family 4-hydroxybenzoate transporter-like MFS transporter
MVPLGGTLGAIFMALLMDKISPYKVLGLAYLGSAVIIALVGFALVNPFWLGFAVFLVGFGVAGAQNGLNLLSASIYPTTARATGVSWAMANGRVGSIIGSVLGAWLIAFFVEPQVFFVALAVPALLGSIAIFSLRRLTERNKTRGLEARPLVS